MHAANRIVEKIERIPELFLFCPEKGTNARKVFLSRSSCYNTLQCYIVNGKERKFGKYLKVEEGTEWERTWTKILKWNRQRQANDRIASPSAMGAWREGRCLIKFVHAVHLPLLFLSFLARDLLENHLKGRVYLGSSLNRCLYLYRLRVGFNESPNTGSVDSSYPRNSFATCSLFHSNNLGFDIEHLSLV